MGMFGMNAMTIARLRRWKSAPGIGCSMFRRVASRETLIRSKRGPTAAKQFAEKNRNRRFLLAVEAANG